MTYGHAELMQNIEALRNVDFNTVPNYQVMKRVYHLLVSKHYIGGDIAAEVAACMYISVTTAAMSDEKIINNMIESTAVMISRLYRQLEIDFGPERARIMLLPLSQKFSITYDVP